MRWPLRALLLGVAAFAIFGPLANLLIWSVAEAWFWPSKLPSQWGFRYWDIVFRPTGRAMESLWLSVWIALLTTACALALSIPAGYALARGKLPWRPVVLLLLIRANVITVADLRERRRHAIVAAFVIAAVMTPPDVLSQLSLAIPMILLYELSIVAAGWFLRPAVPDTPDEQPDKDGA
jgi:ABC-type maltose transport system permease subunit